MNINRVEKHVLGNGRIEFNLFPTVNGLPQRSQAEGFRYFGNTSEFNLIQENKILDHYSSECGVNVKDFSVIKSSTISGSFTLENVDTENLASFFTDDIAKKTQAANQSEIKKVYAGHGYLIGIDNSTPSGKFNVTKITKYANEQNANSNNSGTVLAKNTDYKVSGNGDFITFATTANLQGNDGVWVKIEYSLQQGERELIITPSQMIIGELVFVGCNAVGDNRKYYMPKVSLTPNSDFVLKDGEEWAALSFNIEVLKDEGQPMLYINGVPK